MNVNGQAVSSFFKRVDSTSNITIGWGYNISGYSNSDIHFKGNGYDFTFTDTYAGDRPSKFDPNIYFHPGWFTIPQYNFKLGYNLKNKWWFNFNIDHMKYVVYEQEGTLTGDINVEGFEDNGIYKNEKVSIHDFIYLEHTDGLNYINLQAGYIQPIYFYEKNKVQFSVESSIGYNLGVLFPKTNATILNLENNDEFHVSGFGSGIEGGIILKFFRYFTFNNYIRIGYINMPNILTTPNKGVDKAEQDFLFWQYNFQFGGIIPLRSKSKNGKS